MLCPLLSRYNGVYTINYMTKKPLCQSFLIYKDVLFTVSFPIKSNINTVSFFRQSYKTVRHFPDARFLIFNVKKMRYSWYAFALKGRGR